LREAELSRQMAEYELQVLKLQLHPHFLFNAMNGISTLMARDVKTAREMLVRLSELLRSVLSHSADNEVSLREEVEFVKAYLELEGMRFGKRLRVELDIDRASLEARVPNMIIQPLVENAIQYGIARIRFGGTLGLRTERDDGKLRIVIVNDGPQAAALHRAEGSGIGLANARSRLQQLYGGAYQLRLMERPQGGAELHLEIPFREQERPRQALA
jgi:LytS/YehU family sensor histidine kinase